MQTNGGSEARLANQNAEQKTEMLTQKPQQPQQAKVKEFQGISKVNGLQPGLSWFLLRVSLKRKGLELCLHLKQSNKIEKA